MGTVLEYLYARNSFKKMRYLWKLSNDSEYDENWPY